MAEDRYATLLKKGDRKKCWLELKVFSNQKDNNKELEASDIVLGSIHFSDSREPKSILRDFVKRYVGAKNLMPKNLEGRFSFVEYPFSFEPILTQAFMKYFSEKPLY